MARITSHCKKVFHKISVADSTTLTFQSILNLSCKVTVHFLYGGLAGQLGWEGGGGGGLEKCPNPSSDAKKKKYIYIQKREKKKYTHKKNHNKKV